MTTTTHRPPTVIDSPGVYDLTDETYHGDPVPGGSLSSTGARKLLPPSCPALFHYEQNHPRPYKKTFDIGHAAHKQVLGVGPTLVCVDRPRWDTNEVKAQIADIRAAGGIPLKADEYQQVQEMAAAIRAHPIASALFNPAAGQPEQSLFWRDNETGVWCRARLDWLPSPRAGRLIVPDYKTCRSANPDHLQRAVYEYGYFIQSPWYLDGIQALALADDAAFVFVAQEKEPPYLVTVFEVDAPALAHGMQRARQARRIYSECVATGHWPGYSSEIELVGLPSWVERQLDFDA